MSSRKLVLGLGEILWDLLPAGKQLGGAPANFAYHAHALGAEAQIVSRVGNDALGREILEKLRGLGLATDAVTVDPAAPTGTVSVKLSGDGQPQFTIHEQVAWDQIPASEAVLALAERAEAVCFGSLAQRSEPSRSSVRKVVAATPPGALRIFDINLRQHFHSLEVIETSLQLANAFKINDTELPVVARLLGLSGGAREQLAELARRYELQLVALTRGGGGSVLYAGGHWTEHPGLAVTVNDTVGAGDAFTAAMALGFLSNWPLDEISRQANEAAAFVCTQSGATPPLPRELVSRFQRA
jgi:fructokinase